MARLPTVGSDANAWGTVLNEYLQVGHTSAGRHVGVYNVMEYGATGNGATDDTAALQAAIDAAETASGGLVFLPKGTYIINSGLTVDSDNIQIAGVGWGSVLKAGSSYPTDGVAMITVNGPGGAGNYRWGISIAELSLDGSQRGTVGGVKLVSTYHAHLTHLRVRYCPGIGIYFTGISDARGAYNHAINCVLTDGYTGIAYQTWYSENDVILGGAVAWYHQTGGVGAKLQDGVNLIFGTVFDSCDTAIWINYAQANQIIGVQMTRGYTQFLNFVGAVATVVQGCYLDQFVGSGSKNMINVSAGSAHNVINGNICNTGTGWAYFANDNSTAGAKSLYTHNVLGTLEVLFNASGSIAHGNSGYNPRGPNVTTPSFPANNTAQANTNSTDCWVHITGGTITQIQIGGVATGLTSGTFRLAVGQEIKILYSGSPTWTWFGE